MQHHGKTSDDFKFPSKNIGTPHLDPSPQHDEEAISNKMEVQVNLQQG